MTSRPEGVRSELYEKTPWVIIDLLPLTESQQELVIKHQIPDHRDFFDNLNNYNKGRQQMDVIYQVGTHA